MVPCSEAGQRHGPAERLDAVLQRYDFPTRWPSRPRASILAYPEVRAALAAACRNHDLSDDDLDTAEQGHYFNNPAAPE